MRETKIPFKKEPHHLYQDEVFILMGWDADELAKHLTGYMVSTWSMVGDAEAMAAIMKAGRFEPSTGTFWLRLEARNVPGGGYGLASNMYSEFYKKAKEVFYWEYGDMVRSTCIHTQYPSHCTCGEIPKIPEFLLGPDASFIHYETGQYTKSLCHVHVIPVSDSLSTN